MSSFLPHFSFFSFFQDSQLLWFGRMESSCWCGTLCLVIGVVCRPIVATLPHPKGHGGPVAYVTCAPTRWMCGKETSVFWKSRTGQSADHWVPLLFWIAPKFLMIFYELIEILSQTSQFFHQSRSPLSCLSLVLFCGRGLFECVICVLYFRCCCHGLWKMGGGSSGILHIERKKTIPSTLTGRLGGRLLFWLWLMMEVDGSCGCGGGGAFAGDVGGVGGFVVIVFFYLAWLCPGLFDLCCPVGGPVFSWFDCWSGLCSLLQRFLWQSSCSWRRRSGAQTISSLPCWDSIDTGTHHVRK